MKGAASPTTGITALLYTIIGPVNHVQIVTAIKSDLSGKIETCVVGLRGCCYADGRVIYWRSARKIKDLNTMVVGVGHIKHARTVESEPARGIKVFIISPRAPGIFIPIWKDLKIITSAIELGEAIVIDHPDVRSAIGRHIFRPSEGIFIDDM